MHGAPWWPDLVHRTIPAFRHRRDYLRGRFPSLASTSMEQGGWRPATRSALAEAYEIGGLDAWNRMSR